jgi:hypothetical protein
MHLFKVLLHTHTNLKNPDSDDPRRFKGINGEYRSLLSTESSWLFPR